MRTGRRRSREKRSGGPFFSPRTRIHPLPPLQKWLKTYGFEPFSLLFDIRAKRPIWIILDFYTQFILSCFFMNNQLWLIMSEKTLRAFFFLRHQHEDKGLLFGHLSDQDNL